jgi:hypothetical protein
VHRGIVWVDLAVSGTGEVCIAGNRERLAGVQGAAMSPRSLTWRRRNLAQTLTAPAMGMSDAPHDDARQSACLNAKQLCR